MSSKQESSTVYCYIFSYFYLVHCSGETTSPWFDSQTQHHIWVEFVQLLVLFGSLFFLLPQKTPFQIPI